MLLKLKNYLKNRDNLILFIAPMFFLSFGIESTYNNDSFGKLYYLLFIMFSIILLLSFLNYDENESKN